MTDNKSNLALKIKDLPQPASSRGFNRHIYDMHFCHNADAFPGTLVLSEGQQTEKHGQDKTVDECFHNMGVVCDFFKEAFDYTTVFCNGIPLIGIVHSSFYFPGAWWHPLVNKSLAHVLVFGDGWENNPWKHGESTSDFG